MTKRMLIDATHAEETRVVVMDGNRLEDYDVEAANRKQLKGNIYLAKVIRVEPSLQAAFVEYGGNRHGFLAFSEIHPDYYQIPIADREKLLAIQEEEALAAEAEDETEDELPSGASDEVPSGAEAGDAESSDDEMSDRTPDYVGGETDTGEEALVQKRMARFLRSYKIQEVIRRRQILLVQVVKEERGNKGAALTTYISLAGRYCVLMPNALRGGGVSRKITSVADRRRLKDIIADLQLPRGMAMIVRTAGSQRPRPEVMKDCEYLLHLWDEIREHTLSSVAPALIYEEASLVKRAIRDVYTRDIDDIVVDGENGWRAARDFMRMLMPQSAHKVKLWRKESQPLFSHYHVEGLLDAMLSPTVQLRSGGYLVINQTEALVSIDVNSGRATRERNIEETAVKTNLEAADEVARQLRLRDLAGLIVIDFIDMESRRHNAQVERRLKDALRYDRARIQVGGISHFGLLEMSRQRLRPSVAEAAFATCPHCQGTGIIRGIESAALHVLRAIEEEGGLRRAAEVTVYVAGEIALYILNNKRDWLSSIEMRHKMRVFFGADSSLPPPEVRIERHRAQTARFDNSEPTDIADEPAGSELRQEQADDVAKEVSQAPVKTIPIAETAPQAAIVTGPGDDSEDADAAQTRRRRRRRRRRGGQRDESGNIVTSSGEQEDVGPAARPVTKDMQETTSALPAKKSEIASEENLVPGRMRTRHSRKGTGEVAPPRIQEKRSEPVAQAEKAWRGPTPADPFGGSFDIFDMMEQAEQEEGRPSPSGKQDQSSVPALIPEPADELESIKQTEPMPPLEAEKADAERPAAVADNSGGRRRTRSRRKSGEAVKAEEPTPPVSPTELSDIPLSDEKAAEEAAPRRRGGRRKAGAETSPQQTEMMPEKVRPAISADTEKKGNREPVTFVKPTVIEDGAAVAKPRTGWWRR
ncbi:Rne/Rng family ribonuclease [Acetobacter oeni]|uniref:Ribonuclease E n=1 Tax=Acetobacter oeni TaxID=304077 RepID=A0A511XPU0_9PROT|nr:ribonuclease E/G [Acetobacter oeni]MBB3884661.1 ribonuclease E [Acetobacter oeni]NHO20612.1 Rne/Rng family ribonuclease [Acetobacter oeni]GBR06197.1 ribonuclease E [Acetobacter oeni LMG 21952]GEN64929.1 ribonuclease E [Acetobacter oeni]